MRPACRLLLVDLSYQTYRATSVHRKLVSGSNVFTGGLYGFMATVCKLASEVSADRIAICQDIKPYVRSQEYPQYKQLRAKRRDEELLELYKASLPLVLEFCALVGWPLMGVPGFESDDCIGHVVANHRGRFSHIFAASNDSDLHQLFYCPWFYMVPTDMKGLVHAGTLHDEFGRPLTPQQHSLITALTGTHNDVEGVPRVGWVTALKMVRDPGLLRKCREQHAATIDRNLQLIALPHRQFPADTPVPPMQKSCTRRDLYRWAGKYDITVTAGMLEGLQQLGL